MPSTSEVIQKTDRMRRQSGPPGIGRGERGRVVVIGAASVAETTGREHGPIRGGRQAASGRTLRGVRSVGHGRRRTWRTCWPGSSRSRTAGRSRSASSTTAGSAPCSGRSGRSRTSSTGRGSATRSTPLLTDVPIGAPHPGPRARLLRPADRRRHRDRRRRPVDARGRGRRPRRLLGHGRQARGPGDAPRDAHGRRPRRLSRPRSRSGPAARSTGPSRSLLSWIGFVILVGGRVRRRRRRLRPRQHGQPPRLPGQRDEVDRPRAGRRRRDPRGPARQGEARDQHARPRPPGRDDPRPPRPVRPRRRPAVRRHDRRRDDPVPVARLALPAHRRPPARGPAVYDQPTYEVRRGEHGWEGRRTRPDASRAGASTGESRRSPIRPSSSWSAPRARASRRSPPATSPPERCCRPTRSGPARPG